MDNGRILWVDDEVETLKPHIIFLESKGFKVLTATNGADALVIIAENSFDVPVKFKRIGISDHFPHGYGSQEHMMKRNGISSDHATIAAKKLLGN